MKRCFRSHPISMWGRTYVGSKDALQSVDSGSSNDPSFAIPTNEVNTKFSGLGLHAQWDTRDSQFFPRKGSLADADVSFHDPAVGDDFSYQVYTFSYNHYISLAANQVLALRGWHSLRAATISVLRPEQSLGRGSDLLRLHGGSGFRTIRCSPFKANTTGWSSPNASTSAPSPSLKALAGSCLR